MKDVLDQVLAANKAGLYYVALFGALALPDICAALESADGRATGARYAAWYDAHLPKGPASGEAIYQFRCSLLHQGRTGHPEGFARVLFIEPNSTTIVFHNCVINDALLIDVRLFVAAVVAAAATWATEAAGTQPYEANRRQFVTRYADGLAPYITGVPVIG